MNRVFLAVLLLALVATSGHTQDAPQASSNLVSKILRSLWLQAPPGKQGNKAYEKGDYDLALQKYAQAEAEARSGGKPVDPALAFNAGNALYKQKKYGEAADAWQKALSNRPLRNAKDSSFAARAHYNQGNARYQKGAAAPESATDEAVSDLREALARYKKSLQLNPGDRDAKHNLERAQGLLQQLLKRQEQQKKDQKQTPPQEPSAKAKEALARALQLTQAGRYPEAKAVLENILKSDPTAAPFRSHLQRLDDVLKIQRGEDPTPPVPADPRAQQKGYAI